MSTVRSKKAEAHAAPLKGAEELREAKKLVEEFVRKVQASRRKLDGELLNINRAHMTPAMEKASREDLGRWARKEAGEKVLRTERVSPEEFRIETSGEGLGRLRYTLKSVDGHLRIDLIQRQCDFCLGKGICPHCEAKGCQVCSRTGRCFVCEGAVWEKYSR